LHSLPGERHQSYLQASRSLGMAATRVEERVSCAFGLRPTMEPFFESGSSIPMGGVLLLLPFLIECGLLSYQHHYDQRKGYYNFDSLLLTLSFLSLCRIRSLEQSKLYSPGEFGMLIGYDRIPEVKKLRSMTHELTQQQQSENWAKALSRQWIEEEEPQLYYIDGHVQVYHGYLAELGKKHVSRQRLCLPGMMEFWVNSPEGLPFFAITAEVNEKMLQMLEHEIIPRLVEFHSISIEQQKAMDDNEDYPLFTLVFDREGYSPSFFKRLWEQYRIAVLTYRKNVKDDWQEADFQEMEVETRLGKSSILLHEQETTIDGCPLREIRRLCEGGHQTSIITTNKILTVAILAGYMFGRWIQENFFRYMRQEYALDKIIQYSIDEIDKNVVVVNLEYSNITYLIKKEREKLSRLKAKSHDHRNTESKQKQEEEQKGKWFIKQLELQEQITQKVQQIDLLIKQRKEISYKISIGEMPEECRYNKLNQESKLFYNIVKMICYRAETALANLLAPHYKRSGNEIRSLVKAVIKQTVDIESDYQNKLLKITIYPLANNRSNRAVEAVIEKINETKTTYPNTDLVMNFKITTI